MDMLNALLAQTTTAPVGPAENVHWLDMTVIIGYLALILGFGSFFGRYTKTTRDFFFSGAKFSWWLIAMSLVATGVGSHSFMKYAQIGYEHGMSSSMSYMNDWFFIPLFMFGWLPIIYFSRVRSVPEYFERRFNRPARYLAVLNLLLYMIGYIGYNLFTLATAAHQIIGVDITTAMVVISFVSAIYITAGGQTAVIFTDLLQGFMLMFAGLLLFVLGLDYLVMEGSIVAGFQSLWHHLSLSERLPLAHFNDQNFNFVGVFWQDGIAGSIGFLFVNQGLMMRFMAAKSMTEGRKTIAANVLIMLPISMIVVGNAGWLCNVMVDMGLIAKPEEARDAFVAVAEVVAHPGVFGFILAALCAALMSTMDTLTNATASLFVYDIYQPLQSKQSTDSHYMIVSRVTSFVTAMIGLSVGLMFATMGTDMYSIHAKFQSTITPPLVTTVLLGAFWRRFTTAGAIAALAGGMLAIWIAQWFPALIKPFATDLHGVMPDKNGGYPFMTAMFGIVATAGIGIVVSLFTRPRPFDEIKGLEISSMDLARRLFKGGQPNHEPGRKVRKLALKLTGDGTSAETTRLSLDPATDERLRNEGDPHEVAHMAHRPTGMIDPEYAIIRLSNAEMDALKAREGDLVYLSDSRWWLGGLRSLHARAGQPHDEPGVVHVNAAVLDTSALLPNRKATIEKFF